MRIGFAVALLFTVKEGESCRDGDSHGMGYSV